MSARRFPEDKVQPVSFTFLRAFGAKASTSVGEYLKGREKSAMIGSFDIVFGEVDR
jgi:NADH:ubiquinone oxidoreductase subunit D